MECLAYLDNNSLSKRRTLGKDDLCCRLIRQRSISL